MTRIITANQRVLCTVSCTADGGLFVDLKFSPPMPPNEHRHKIILTTAQKLAIVAATRIKKTLSVESIIKDMEQSLAEADNADQGTENGGGVAQAQQVNQEPSPPVWQDHWRDNDCCGPGLDLSGNDVRDLGFDGELLRGAADDAPEIGSPLGLVKN